MSNQQSVDNTTLQEILLKEIDNHHGRIPFRRFMELALYHPEYGYYASGRARIGKKGDFITNVSIGCIYGRLLASICREAWERLGFPDEFTIIEQGANDGTMAFDILEAVHGDHRFAQALRYIIVEPFGINRDRQQQKLSTFANIHWMDSLKELPHFTGIHLSNELLDAFPVHSLKWDGHKWEEECVCRDGDKLIWKTYSIEDASLAAAAELLQKNLPTGFRIEVNLEMKSWLEAIHKKMNRGIILTIDYGQSGEDRYAPHRVDGTLLAYQNHRRFNDPLPDPGFRDITAQVDFTTLAREARTTGFKILGYSDQHHFLISAAEPWLRSISNVMGDSTPEHQTDLRSLQTLLHPSSMGMQFKAIALAKNFPEKPHLACFKFQRPGVEAL